MDDYNYTVTYLKPGDSLPGMKVIVGDWFVDWRSCGFRSAYVGTVEFASEREVTVDGRVFRRDHLGFSSGAEALFVIDAKSIHELNEHSKREKCL